LDTAASLLFNYLYAPHLAAMAHYATSDVATCQVIFGDPGKDLQSFRSNQNNSEITTYGGTSMEGD
jgi:hypothetical protein